MNATPLKCIRRHCLWCCNGQSPEVSLCPSEGCPLHPFRFGKRILGRSTVKAIRLRCLDCVGGSHLEVGRCDTDCHLHRYRFGKNPNFSEETRAKRREAAILRKTPAARSGSRHEHRDAVVE